MENQNDLENQGNTENQYDSTATPTTEIKVNEGKLEKYIEKLRTEQNLGLAIAAGLGSSIVGAILWAIITVATGYQLGLMAIAVGFIVGYCVRYLGKGLDQPFGIIGAIFALLGCFMGNYFSIVGIAADELGMGYVETLGSVDLAAIPEIMAETFSFMDIVFYGIAVYEGYKFSFRQITEEEIREHATEKIVSNNG